MTDWGAHHVDIAQWAIGMDKTGPNTVEGTAEHPCPMKDGHPTVSNKYNVASKFNVNCQFPNGVEVVITSEGDNACCSREPKAASFVNRGKIEGKPVEELKEKPLPEGLVKEICKGKDVLAYKGNEHMANFFDCVKTREEPSPTCSPTTGDDDLSPGEHRHPPRPQDHLGPRSRRNRRRLGSQTMARPRTAQGV